MYPSLDPKRRFDLHVERLPGDGCWIWTGGVSSSGYGIFYWAGKSEHAHRASYAMNVGMIEDGGWVLHHCDEKRCVRPDHLYVGTREQNVRDAIQRKRMATGSRHGSHTKPESFADKDAHPTTRICRATAMSIHLDLAAGESAFELADRHGVHVSTIYRARDRAAKILGVKP